MKALNRPKKKLRSRSENREVLSWAEGKRVVREKKKGRGGRLFLKKKFPGPDVRSTPQGM